MAGANALVTSVILLSPQELNDTSFMDVRELFPWTYGLAKVLTGRSAGRIYLTLIVLASIAVTVPRIRAMFMARQMYAVLSGMQKLRIDQTSEEELLKAVPGLVRSPYEDRWENGIERHYDVAITNERDWERLVFRSRIPEWISIRVLDWCGYRYTLFYARVDVLNGRVSAVSYGIAPQHYFPRLASAVIFARSAHGFWAERRYPFRVDSLDDESPRFRVHVWDGGGKSDPFLNVTYTPDAPAEMIERVFDLNLSCFWSLRGCVSPEQISPQLWRDGTAIRAATLFRLTKSNDPCPDRVLAGRVRYLLDLDVLLLEVTKSGKLESVGDSGVWQESLNDYRVKEVVRASPIYGVATGKSWKDVPWAAQIGSPNFRGLIANPLPALREGDRVLFFGGEDFHSCQFVPATPSAVAAVRAAVPASKRPEDRVSLGKAL